MPCTAPSPHLLCRGSGRVAGYCGRCATPALLPSLRPSTKAAGVAGTGAGACACAAVGLDEMAVAEAAEPVAPATDARPRERPPRAGAPAKSLMSSRRGSMRLGTVTMFLSAGACRGRAGAGAGPAPQLIAPNRHGRTRRRPRSLQWSKSPRQPTPAQNSASSPPRSGRRHRPSVRLPLPRLRPRRSLSNWQLPRHGQRGRAAGRPPPAPAGRLWCPTCPETAEEGAGLRGTL